MADEIDVLNQKIISLEREKHLLLRKIEELEVSGNHQRVILELKEREIRGLKQKLEELNNVVEQFNELKKEKDAIYTVMDELAERVREMLIKVSELEKKLKIQENVIFNNGVFGVNVKWVMMTASIVVAAIAIGISSLIFAHI